MSPFLLIKMQLLDTYIYARWIFGKSNSMEEGTPFQWFWGNKTSPGWKINLTLNFIPHTEINSTWIMDLNIECKMTEFLENNRSSLKKKRK